MLSSSNDTTAYFLCPRSHHLPSLEKHYSDEESCAESCIVLEENRTIGRMEMVQSIVSACAVSIQSGKSCQKCRDLKNIGAKIIQITIEQQ